MSTQRLFGAIFVCSDIYLHLCPDIQNYLYVDHSNDISNLMHAAPKEEIVWSHKGRSWIGWIIIIVSVSSPQGIAQMFLHNSECQTLFDRVLRILPKYKTFSENKKLDVLLNGIHPENHDFYYSNKQVQYAAQQFLMSTKRFDKQKKWWMGTSKVNFESKSLL